MVCKVQSENFGQEDQECPSRPAVVDDQLKMLIKNNLGHTTWNVAENLHISGLL